MNFCVRKLCHVLTLADCVPDYIGYERLKPILTIQREKLSLADRKIVFSIIAMTVVLDVFDVPKLCVAFVDHRLSN
jgi:hypothetical protein